MNNIVVFSPNRYSLYTTTVTALLVRHCINISGIYVRKMIDPSRFLPEYSRDSSRLLKKIWRKLVLRQAAYHPGNLDNIIGFRKKHAITINDVAEFEGRHSIPVFYCSSLNSPLVVKGLQNYRPDLVIFTGGGLIRKEILENSGNGILNCHMGILPTYRGMDVVEWAILEGQLNQVGITTHFMDKGVDTGDILACMPVPPKRGETIQALRDRLESTMCQFLVDSCLHFLNGDITRKPQKLQEGRQYFMMHPGLIKLAGSKLSSSQELLNA
jgi:methionyl-tRNA formyltransferase